jgi:hypothetical protein
MPLCLCSERVKVAADLRAAIDHHTANMVSALKQTGLCTFDAPPSMSEPGDGKAEGKAEGGSGGKAGGRHHETRHRHRRLTKRHASDHASGRSEGSGVDGEAPPQQRIVFLAADSLELKVMLDDMHNTRSAHGSAHGGNSANGGHNAGRPVVPPDHPAALMSLEWFNVTNAHIAAISRTHEKVGLEAAFELPKLMTMVS